jgi:hypothetical protein
MVFVTLELIGSMLIHVSDTTLTKDRVLKDKPQLDVSTSVIFRQDLTLTIG